MALVVRGSFLAIARLLGLGLFGTRQAGDETQREKQQQGLKVALVHGVKARFRGGRMVV